MLRFCRIDARIRTTQFRRDTPLRGEIHGAMFLFPLSREGTYHKTCTIFSQEQAMSSISEKRSSLRLSIPLKMEIEKAGREQEKRLKTEVILSNISAGGAYFETDRWQLFDIGTTVDVTVGLPPSPSYEALGLLKLRSSATVLRIQPAAAPPAEGDPLKRHGVAIKFNRPLSLT